MGISSLKLVQNKKKKSKKYPNSKWNVLFLCTEIIAKEYILNCMKHEKLAFHFLFFSLFLFLFSISDSLLKKYNFFFPLLTVANMFLIFFSLFFPSPSVRVGYNFFFFFFVLVLHFSNYFHFMFTSVENDRNFTINLTLI